jgi:uncharacterized membrane protein YvbJ
MKYCPKCGASLDDDQGVCHRCGQSIALPQRVIIERPHRQEEYNVSGWWAGLFFSWLGVLILVLTNINKTPRQKRHVIAAIVWAAIITVVAIVAAVGLI